MQIRRVVAAFALLMSSAAYGADWSDPHSLVALAQANDPALVRMRAEVAAARERAGPAAARPNPMLMAGIQNKMIDLRDDDMMTMYMVGASQTFVSREKREARRALLVLPFIAVLAPAAPSPRVITVKVTAGDYQPSVINVAKGETVRLKFLRVEDPSCGDGVSIPSMKVKKALPLNEPVFVDLKAEKSGEIAFRLRDEDDERPNPRAVASRFALRASSAGGREGRSTKSALPPPALPPSNAA